MKWLLIGAALFGFVASSPAQAGQYEDDGRFFQAEKDPAFAAQLAFAQSQQNVRFDFHLPFLNTGMQPIVATSYLGNGFEAHAKRILRAWRRAVSDPTEAVYAVFVQAGIDQLPVVRASLPGAMIHPTGRYIVAALCCDTLREQWMLSQGLIRRLGLAVG